MLLATPEPAPPSDRIPTGRVAVATMLALGLAAALLVLTVLRLRPAVAVFPDSEPAPVPSSGIAPQSAPHLAVSPTAARRPTPTDPATRDP